MFPSMLPLSRVATEFHSIAPTHPIFVYTIWGLSISFFRLFRLAPRLVCSLARAPWLAFQVAIYIMECGRGMKLPTDQWGKY